MKPIYADLDKIVFEDREQGYGSFVMRAKANKMLVRASLIGFLFFLGITVIPVMGSWFFPKEDVEAEKAQVKVVALSNWELPPPPQPEEKVELPPPPAKKIEPPKVETIKFLVPEPKADVKEDESIAVMDSVEAAPNIGFDNIQGDDLAGFDWSSVEPTGTGTEDVTFVDDGRRDIREDEFILLDEEPRPVNLDDIKDAIGYPPMAVEAEIEGTVIVRVQVSTSGDYVKHVVKKNPHPVLTNAVQQYLDQLKFTPGIQGGKPIKVWVTVPIKFSLVR